MLESEAKKNDETVCDELPELEKAETELLNTMVKENILWRKGKNFVKYVGDTHGGWFLDNRAKWEQKVMLKDDILGHEIYFMFDNMRPYNVR